MSGLATHVMSFRALRPSRLAISASVDRSGSDKSKPGRQVGSEDAILSHQAFVAQQQLLVDKARYKGQKAGPLKSVAHGRRSIIDHAPFARSRHIVPVF